MKTQRLLFIGMIAVVGMIIYYVFNTAQTDDAYVQDLIEFRKDKDRRFLEEDESPLDKAQKGVFDSLRYFDPNPAYRIVADLEWMNNAPAFSLPTTADGQTQEYRRIAEASFQLGGKPQEVVLLESVERPDEPNMYLFFRDETSGEDTYGAGRYVEVEKRRKKTCIIDFNRAYNPYCAYNEYYVCPIPPKENYISVRVEAGEKLPGIKGADDREE